MNTAANPADAMPHRSWFGATKRLSALGPIMALLALIFIGSMLSDSFLSAGNLSNLLTRSAIVGIIAIGATYVITAGGLDLSVGSMSALIAGLVIMGMNAAGSSLGDSWLAVLIGIVLALALGVVAGSLNGVLVVKGGIDAFIVTLGTMGIFRSVITWLSDGGSISLSSSLKGIARPLYYGSVAGVSYPLIAMIVLAIGAELVLRRARLGRHITAIGSNPEVARYSAIRVHRVRILTYVFQGVCVALATMIYVPRLGAATPSTGLLWELEAIAAVIIGGTALKGGFGRIWGSIVGVLILGLIDNILNLTALASPYLNGAFQGVIIIIAVYLQKGRREV
ncbi:ABC transporter permease [Mesorhizobium sp. B2-4-17]|uniref:ABC transporter permease n=1 Tax=Mesorhizobium sp. B2-4-17 TaxID=2589932 RepID=UPI001FEDBDF6|nr:ABC transporter permease [Mesorhizobium sp. B2-4-17]